MHCNIIHWWQTDHTLTSFAPINLNHCNHALQQCDLQLCNMIYSSAIWFTILSWFSYTTKHTHGQRYRQCLPQACNKGRHFRMRHVSLRCSCRIRARLEPRLGHSRLQSRPCLALQRHFNLCKAVGARWTIMLISGGTLFVNNAEPLWLTAGIWAGSAF